MGKKLKGPFRTTNLDSLAKACPPGGSVMNQRIARTGLALVTLLFLWVGTGAAAEVTADGFKDSIVSRYEGPQPVAKPFKLKAGGQIDTNTLTFNFAGTATHLGLFAASGTIDPSNFQIEGTMTAADGDTLDWVAQIQPGPLGEFEVTFTFTGGTGRFTRASGSAGGAGRSRWAADVHAER